MTVTETPAFTHEAKSLLSEDERNDLILFLAENPEAGDIIEQTGGVRKVRWARQGGGKSGGYRVIYYYYTQAIPLFCVADIPQKPQRLPHNGGEERLEEICGRNPESLWST